MKSLALFLGACAVFAHMAFAASPAATQQWVINYIATTVVQTAEAKKDFSTNTVSGIMNNIRLQMAIASISTNALTNAVTNTNGGAR